MNNKNKIVEALKPLLIEYLSVSEIEQKIEKPNNKENGDLAFPTYTVAKFFRKSPQEISKELVEQMDTSNFHEVAATGPYINFFFNRKEMTNEVLHAVLEQVDEYGSSDIGHGGNVLIDMSSPNIAKPMSMGHLRSTVIGNALGNIYEKIH